MNIRPPYGYQEIIPLARQHRVRLPPEGTVPEAFRSVNAVPLSFVEFAFAARDYPIAFTAGEGGNFVAMAVLGLDNRQNLFVAADGKWDASCYVPAYVRRHPFCMTRVVSDGRPQPQRIACVEKSALADDGEALCDAAGEDLPAWAARKKLLFEFEADLARTEEMCGVLGGLGLIEPFTMQADPGEGKGTPVSMTGLHRVNEEKLNALDGGKLKELAHKGMLSRIYSHLASLSNFSRLLDRRVAAGATKH
jgi:hypothetical protein